MQMNLLVPQALLAWPCWPSLPLTFFGPPLPLSSSFSIGFRGGDRNLGNVRHDCCTFNLLNGRRNRCGLSEKGTLSAETLVMRVTHVANGRLHVDCGWQGHVTSPTADSTLTAEGKSMSCTWAEAGACERAFLKFAGVVGVPARRRAPWLMGLRGNSTYGNDWSADEEPRFADIENKPTMRAESEPGTKMATHS